jgi:hypothetical protein
MPRNAVGGLDLGKTPLASTEGRAGLTGGRAAMKHGLRDRFCASRQIGPNGNYLFELEAQPGGPEGRSDMTAGSKPIRVIERPRNVRPLVLPFSWTRELARRRFVPYPVIPLKSLRTCSASSQSRLRCLCHTWYGHEGNRLTRSRISSGQANDYKTTYTWDYRNRLTDVEYHNNQGTLTKHVLTFTTSGTRRSARRSTTLAPAATTGRNGTPSIWRQSPAPLPCRSCSSTATAT